MYRLEKSFRFEASHSLPNHDGKCARLHGHSWTATIGVEGNELWEEGPKAGMLLDFGDVTAAMTLLLRDRLDHHHLNDSIGLTHPTSEHVAEWLFEQLLGRVPMLADVTIEETCTAKCRYRKKP